MVFGILGGYLRYLAKAASKEGLIPEILIPETKKIETSSSDFLHVTLGELAQIFLSSLLATVVWFIISQGSNTNIYTLAAVSFSIGLVTKEIIGGIIRFVTGVVVLDKGVS